MKVLAYNIPSSNNKTVIFQDEILPYCFPHLHRHEEIQITLIQKGEGKLEIGDKIYQYGPNEVYVIGANMPHVFKSKTSYNDRKSSTHTTTIYFNPKGPLSTLFDLPELQDIYMFLKNYESGFRIPANAFDDISNKIFGLKYTNQLELLLQFMELLKTMGEINNLSPLAPGIKGASEVHYDAERMNNICAFITENYSQDLTLDIVAKKAYMTPQAFCRFFKKHTGTTFITFLSKIRINEACRKLSMGGHDSVSSVAINCGFSNISNFNRVFKMIVGKSPSSYIYNSVN